MHARFATFAVLATAATARADDVAVLDEISAGASDQTAVNPRSSWIADKIGGLWNPAEPWQLRFDFTATRDSGTAPTTGSFGDSGGTVLLATFSTEYDPNDDISIKLAAGYSPSSTTTTSTTVSFMAQNDSDARLRSTTSSAMGQLALGYDTSLDGKGSFQPAALFTTTLNYFDTLQRITAVQTKTGRVLNVAQIEAFCTANAGKCSPQLLAALKAQSASLVQVVLDLNVGAQLYTNTDVNLDGQYYVYNTDPTQIGYFSVAAAGRTAAFGGGIGIAPLQYAFGPSVDHRFGQLFALLQLTYGKYVVSNGVDQGYNLTTTLRVQYKWKLSEGRRVKLWGKLTGARDVDVDNNVVKSIAMFSGVSYQW